MHLSLDITDMECSILEDSLINVGTWVSGALAGKIANCKKRMVEEWLPRLYADPDVATIPADVDGIVAMVLGRDDYLNRVDRDAAALYDREERLVSSPVETE